MVTETQGNESTGSTENTGSAGGETAGAQETSAPAAAAEMPDDPKYAETGGDELTGAAEPKKAAVVPPTQEGYKPNHKFKVLDKEQEFDDWLKPHIKDEETEKKARDLYERAHGLEYVKQDRQRLKEQTFTQQNQIAHHETVIGNVNKMLAGKDYDNLFGNVLKIPEDDILRQAQKILQIRELPPEQQQAYRQAGLDRQRAMDLELQNMHLTQSHEQVAVNARTQELDWTLQRPDISQLATAYDARVGTQGAFRTAVIERGKYHALVSNGTRDLTPEQAINEVLSFLGGPKNLMPAQAAPVVNQGQPAVPERKPVITNIQGRGTSPAKKMIKSIDDLKKRAKELAIEA